MQALAAPEKFFESLHALNLQLVETRSFADHHAYTAQDIESLMQTAAAKGAHLITTAKDAVKIPVAARGSIVTLPIALAFEQQAIFTEFLQRNLAHTATS